jgi:excisionase family DNA binding protein
MIENGGDGSKILTTDDLESLQVEVAALRAKIDALSRTPESPLLNREEASEYLRLSVRTLNTIVAEGELCPIRIRGRVLFHIDTLNAYIRSRAEREGRSHE